METVIPALNTVVHNEANRIVALLTHAATFCDELIVIDQDSNDGTGELARDFGATVIWDECRGYAELSYPLAARHTEGRYILILDADEILLNVSGLIGLDDRWDGAWLSRATFVDGIPFNAHSADRQLRYVRKGMPTYPTRIHTYTTMPAASTVYRSGRDPWILHTKTGREQAMDDIRYDGLREVNA